MKKYLFYAILPLLSILFFVSCQEKKPVALLDEECCDAKLEIVLKSDSLIYEDLNLKLTKIDSTKEINKEIKTDSILLENLCEGKYKLEVTSKLYKSYSNEIDVKCGEKNKLITQIERIINKDTLCCDSKIKLTIQSLENSSQLQNVKVILKGDSIEKTSYSDINGNVEFINVCKGKYTLDISLKEFTSTFLTKEINCAENIQETIKLKAIPIEPDKCCDSKLKLITKNVLGEEISASKVTLFRNGKNYNFAPSGNDNYLYFSKLCEGKYQLTIEINKFEKFEKEIQINCGDNTYTAIMNAVNDTTKCCDGSIIIFAVDSLGNKIHDSYTLLLINNEGYANPQSIYNGAEYNFKELCKGQYRVEAISLKYYNKIDTFNIDCGNNFTHKVFMSKRPRDYSECCDSELEVVIEYKNISKGGEEVILTDKNNKVIQTQKTAGNGSVKFKNLCKGEYKMKINGKIEHYFLECGKYRKVIFMY
jgi:hypothetical protein